MAGGRTTEVRQIRIETVTKGDRDIKAIADRLGGLNRQLRGVSTSASIFNFSFAGLLSYFSGRQIISISDDISLLATRIDVLSGSSEKGAEAMAKIAKVAKETYTPLDNAAEIYARMAATTKELGVSTDQLARLTKLLANSFRLSGATATEATATAIQLSQGFASGQLRGQELRSVLEANVVLGEALAKSFGVTRGELYKLAEAGQLTADKALKAFFDAENSINDAANKLAPTIGMTLSKAFVSLQLAVLEVNKKFEINQKFADAVTFAMTNIEKIILVVASIAIPLIIAKLSAMAVALAAATGGFSLLTASAAATGAVIALQSDTFEDFNNSLKKIALAYLRIKLAVDTAAESVINFFFPAISAALQVYKLFGFNNTKKTKELVDSLTQEVEQYDRLKKLSSSLQKNTFDFTGGFGGNEKDVFNNTAKKVLTLDQQIGALGRRLKEGKISFEEYNDAISRLELKDLENDLYKGKISWEKYTEGVEKLRKLDLSREFREGSLTLDEYSRKLNDLKLDEVATKFNNGKASLKEYNDAILKFKNDLNFKDVFSVAVKTYIEDLGSVAEQTSTIIQGAFKNLEDAIFEATKAGKYDFNNFVQAVLDDINRLVIRMLVIRPLLAGIETGLSSIVGTTSPTGGGGGGMSTIQKTSGGGDYLRPIYTGEGTMSKSSGSSGGNVYVNVNNNSSGVEVSTAEKTNSDGSKTLELIIDSRISKAFSNGTMDKNMSMNYGLKRRGY